MKSWIYILFLLLLFSCDDTLFNEGDIVTKEIEISDFEKIYVHDIFDIYLLQDTVCKIEVKGGSNLLPNLEFNVDTEKILTIDDNNTARWSREYNKIELYISVNTLSWFELKAPCNVSCLDTLKLPHVYFVTIDDYSELDLLVKSNFLYFVNSGTSGGILTVKGETDIFNFWARASVKINAQNFIANKTTVKSESIGDCYIHANEYINVEILNDGNIYYTGSPETIEYVNDRAREQLIELN